MTEIRDIFEPTDATGDCVIVRRDPSGKFVAGSLGSKLWGPFLFDTVTDAIRQSRGWAEDNDVSVVYVVQKRWPSTGDDDA